MKYIIKYSKKNIDNNIIKNNLKMIGSGNISIKLLSYNTFMRPPPLGIFLEYKEERLNYLIENKFANFDIICLQEVFGNFNNRKNKLKNEMEKKGFKYSSTCYNCFFCNGKIIDCGLLILSRYKILKTKFQSFETSTNIDSFSEKGILYCEINLTNNIPIHVFCLHMQASYTYVPNENSIKVREKQLDIICNFIKLIINDKDTPIGPIILTGDFNINSLINSNLNKEENNIIIEEYNNLNKKMKKLIEVISINGNNYEYGRNIFFDKYKKNIETFIPNEWNKKDKTELKSSLFIDKNIKLENTKKTFWAPQCLDYTFLINPKKKNIYADVISCEINSFSVKNKNYRQLSDHNALISEIEIKY
jgi:endonuclease/exonuclease/phosphatase family metal-dependent hydrolase